MLVIIFVVRLNNYEVERNTQQEEKKKVVEKRKRNIMFVYCWKVDPPPT